MQVGENIHEFILSSLCTNDSCFLTYRMNYEQVIKVDLFVVSHLQYISVVSSDWIRPITCTFHSWSGYQSFKFAVHKGQKKGWRCKFCLHKKMTHNHPPRSISETTKLVNADSVGCLLKGQCFNMFHEFASCLCSFSQVLHIHICVRSSSPSFFRRLEAFLDIRFLLKPLCMSAQNPQSGLSWPRTNSSVSFVLLSSRRCGIHSARTARSQDGVYLIYIYNIY